MTKSEDIRFTPKFLAAIERVGLAGKADPDNSKVIMTREFVREMIELGWKERIANLYRVKDKIDGKFRFFRPNSAQKEFIENKTGRDTILKARQFGFTTLACIYAYDRALFDGWSTGIMSHQRERTEKIFDIVKNANEFFLKDWGHLWTPEQESNNTYKISWKDSKASITVAYDFRSLTVQFLHVSEAAFIEVDRLTNSLQSVSEFGETIEESTPNGPGGVFYNHWKNWKALGERASNKGHFFPWYSHYPEDVTFWKEQAKKYPGGLTERERELTDAYGLKPYHIAWRRWKIQESCNGDEEIFEREYASNDEDCFLSGESQVYSRAVLKYQKSFVCPPAHVGFLKVEGKKISYYADQKGLLKIWALPDVDGEYVIGGDSSEGIGKDAAVAYVMRRSTGRIVAELFGQIPPSMFADELWKLATFYNQAWVNPEANNHGHQVIEELTRKGYSKIYKRYSIDELTNRPTTKLGFLTTVTTKIPLTEAHVTACRDGSFQCVSETLFEQMSNFIQLASKSGRSFRREARADNHDDAVMAACLTWEMHKKLGDSRKNDMILPDDLRRAKVDEDTGCFIDVGSSSRDLNEDQAQYEDFTGYGFN